MLLKFLDRYDIIELLKVRQAVMDMHKFGAFFFLFRIVNWNIWKNMELF